MIKAYKENATGARCATGDTLFLGQFYGAFYTQYWWPYLLHFEANITCCVCKWVCSLTGQPLHSMSLKIEACCLEISLLKEKPIYLQIIKCRVKVWGSAAWKKLTKKDNKCFEEAVSVPSSDENQRVWKDFIKRMLLNPIPQTRSSENYTASEDVLSYQSSDG